jgi:hypothetical protein
MKELRMRAFFGIVGLAGAGFLLSGVTSTVGCSSSSSGGSSGSTGTAGSTGHGGTTGTAGTTGTGGASSGGSGGGGGGVALGCPASDPPPAPAPIIADFGSTDGGSPVIPIGGTFTYGSPAPTAAVESGAWHITLTAPGTASAQYLGVGIYFNGNSAGTDCIDGTPYTGIKFDVSASSMISGTGCTAQFSTNDSAHSNNATDPKGAGDSSSYAPQAAFTIPSGGGTVMIPFTGPTGGSPATPLDKTKLTGVQWQFTVAAGTTNNCAVDITLDNISFY